MINLGKPIIYLYTSKSEFLNKEALDLVKKFLIFVDMDTNNWENNFKNIINKPYKELKSIWEDKKIYRDKGIDISKGFPQIWGYNFINIHNCIITSSVIIKKSILEETGYMKNLPNGKEDYDCWKRCLKHTNSVYLDDDVYFYYSSISDHTNKYDYI
jgi:hypothetical protein